MTEQVIVQEEYTTETSTNYTIKKEFVNVLKVVFAIITKLSGANFKNSPVLCL